MIDQIYQKTGGVEWEEVEDKVGRIVREEVAKGTEHFVLLTTQCKQHEATFVDWLPKENKEQ